MKLTKNHESLLKTYHFDIEDTDDGKSYEAKILALQNLINTGKLAEANAWNAGQMVAICFKQHLYYPLFALEGDAPLKMRPVVFDAPSETQFVRDLQTFYESAIGKEIIGDRSLYLLRNADNKAKGLGFALAGNFYPDFLLWLVDNASGKQWLNFVDPKGLRQMNLSDPKLGLYNEVRVLEKKLAGSNLSLNAFIVSATQFSNLLNVSLKQADLEAKNVLFMPDGKDIYLKKMFERICQ